MIEGIKTVIEFGEKFELKIIIKSLHIAKVKKICDENKESYDIRQTRLKEFYEIRIRNVNIKRAQTIKTIFDEAKIDIITA